MGDNSILFWTFLALNLYIQGDSKSQQSKFTKLYAVAFQGEFYLQTFANKGDNRGSERTGFILLLAPSFQSFVIKC